MYNFDFVIYQRRSCWGNFVIYPIIALRRAQNKKISTMDDEKLREVDVSKKIYKPFHPFPLDKGTKTRQDLLLLI